MYICFCAGFETKCDSYRIEKPLSSDGFRVRPSSSPSSYPVSPSLSAAANPDLRALLLNPAAVGRLKAAAGRGAAAARRRAAWTRAWAGLRREEAELEEEVMNFFNAYIQLLLVPAVVNTSIDTVEDNFKFFVSLINTELLQGGGSSGIRRKWRTGVGSQRDQSRECPPCDGCFKGSQVSTEERHTMYKKRSFPLKTPPTISCTFSVRSL